MSTHIGYRCSRYTAQKNEDFQYILHLHIKITRATLYRNPWASKRYHYFDITAGPGGGQFGLGSPLIFMGEIGLAEIPYQAVFIDQDERACERLTTALSPYMSQGRISVHCGNHHEILKKYIFDGRPDNKQFGLIYDDPSGQIPSFDLLADFATCHHRIDILVYVSSTNIKRQYHCNLCSCNLRLDEYIKRIPKRVWLIREPQGCHQWTFLIGTNWDSFPAFKNKGFYYIDSPEGQAILERANYTREELNGTNGTLFN
jgi:three-Cys-motif partner protein